MIQVKVYDDESLERALKRFKRKCEKEGLAAEIRKRAFYDKPSVKKRKKALAARKRARKKTRR
jgi:small subunit ribosomal protein S21